MEPSPCVDVTDHGRPPGPGASRGSAQGWPARGYWWRSGQRPASPPLQPTLPDAPAARAPLHWGEDSMLNSRHFKAIHRLSVQVSLFGWRLKYSKCSLDATSKYFNSQQVLLANMFSQNENTSLTKCSGDEMSSVICNSSLVFKFLQIDFHSWN